jgi:hypothetical protein
VLGAQVWLLAEALMPHDEWLMIALLRR